MKTKLFLIAILALGTSLCANAWVSVDKTLSEEYMLNNGYSEQIYDTVNVSRARALGKEYYSQAELNYKNLPKGRKFWRRLHAYVDPAVDDYSFYHHDTTPEPTVDDL